MSNGLLGKALTVTNTEVTVYTVPATADFATISIILVNQDVADATIKVAITPNAVAAPVDYVDFNSIIPANGGSLEHTCIVLSAGENVIVEANSALVAVRVFGLEKLI